MKFSFQDFFSKCDQIRMKLRIWLHLLKKSLMENFIFCTVKIRSALTGILYKQVCFHPQAQICLIEFIAKNTVISPNFLVGKFCGKEKFPHRWNYGIFCSDFYCQVKNMLTKGLYLSILNFVLLLYNDSSLYMQMKSFRSVWCKALLTNQTRSLLCGKGVQFELACLFWLAFSKMQAVSSKQAIV